MSRFARSQKGFTLIEIMIVVLIIGILLAIAVPNFVTARKNSRTKACIATMKQIESAMEQFAMKENKKSGDAIVPATDLIGADKYIKTEPKCPSGGTYSGNDSVGGTVACSVHVKDANGKYTEE